MAVGELTLWAGEQRDNQTPRHIEKNLMDWIQVSSSEALCVGASSRTEAADGGGFGGLRCDV
eukprot:3469394-Rhodomonas_salina.1